MSRRSLALAAVSALSALGAAAAIAPPAGASSSTTETTQASDTTDAVETTEAPEPIDPRDATVEVEGDALEVLPEDPDDADPAIGEIAPLVTGTGYDGVTTEIGPDTHDGPTMIVFLAHWCPHCNREIPVLNEWREDGGVPDDMRVVGVSTAVGRSNQNYPPDEWLEEMDWEWDVLADDPDSTTARAYGVSGFPFFVFLAPDGEVIMRGSGELDAETLDSILDVVAEAVPETTETTEDDSTATTDDAKDDDSKGDTDEATATTEG